jgi:hypothetical protein
LAEFDGAAPDVCGTFPKEAQLIVIPAFREARHRPATIVQHDEFPAADSPVPPA